MIVLTKVDISSPQQIHCLEEEIFSLLEAAGKRAVVMGRRLNDDKTSAMEDVNVISSITVPIFKVSNVSAEGFFTFYFVYYSFSYDYLYRFNGAEAIFVSSSFA